MVLLSWASLETPSILLHACLYDLKFISLDLPFPWASLNYLWCAAFFCCIGSVLCHPTVLQFSQVPIFLTETSAWVGLLQTEDSLPCSYDWVFCWSPWAPNVSLWCHTFDIMPAPGLSCSALVAYAWINNYCGVINCYYFVISRKSFST